MLESFSAQAVQIIEEAKKIASELDSPIVGSEHLLLSMYQTPDSICRFLLQEQKITYDDLLNTLNNITVIHKIESKDLTFTDKFQEIVLKASDIAEQFDSDYVFDEHLFYSILEDDASIASEMLKMLHLDIISLKKDVEDIFNFDNFDNSPSAPPYPFLINLSTQSETHPYITRSNYIERINYILEKKQKNNPLLIGSAGVGKTAIIGGLSKLRTNDTIYQLDLGGAVAGTKYRGELEEKILKVMEYVKQNKAILFIDEIHNIVGAGSNDGSLDIANILKPYLSRADISIIGATTLEEYYKFFDKDKALMRRFQTIFIDEPNKKETKKILMGIKSKYEEFHHFSITEKNIDYIINICNSYLPHRTFPDKAIDVLDEVGARYSETKKNIYKLIKEVVFDLTNIYITPLNILRKLNLNYNILKPSYIKFNLKMEDSPNIVKAIVSNDFIVDPLLDDLSKVFNLKKEMYLEVNLENYQDSSMISNLIGSSKGYVGYEEGGILSEHIIKYPISVIYLKNYDKAHISVKNLIDRITSSKTMIDNKGRKINLENTIFIINKELKDHQVGFITNDTTISKDIYLNTIKKPKPKNIYHHLLKKYKIQIDEFNLDIIDKQIYNLILLGRGHYTLDSSNHYIKQNQ
ncbi:MAG: AAA family ATPase [Bacilli bacterium]